MKTLSCNEAKQIPINEYLAEMGIRPAYSKGNDLWYLSPLRDEKHPSFKVNTKLNAWYDHGTGEGGSIIDRNPPAQMFGVRAIAKAKFRKRSSFFSPA